MTIHFDSSNSIYCSYLVFEYQGELYEDLRPSLNHEFNKDLLDAGIKFRLIITEDDYDYVESDELNEALTKLRANC